MSAIICFILNFNLSEDQTIDPTLQNEPTSDSSSDSDDSTKSDIECETLLDNTKMGLGRLMIPNAEVNSALEGPVTLTHFWTEMEKWRKFFEGILPFFALLKPN